MKLLLVFALVHLASALPGVTNETCKQMENIVELLLNGSDGSSNDTHVPANTTELAEFCTNLKFLWTDLAGYQKCLPEFPRKVYTASTRSIGKTMEKSCGAEAEKQKLLKVYQCLNQGGKTAKINACSFGTRNVLGQLAESGEGQSVTAAFCCLSLLNEDCLAKRLNQFHCEDASVKLGEHYDIVSGPLHSDVLSGICQDYSTIAACEAKIPNEFAKFKVTVFNETVRFGGRSLLKSLVKVSERVSPQTSN